MAALVALICDRIGKAKFGQLLGKPIALNAQTITNFCQKVGIHGAACHNLIRIAKNNGKKLGLLA